MTHRHDPENRGVAPDVEAEIDKNQRRGDRTWTCDRCGDTTQAEDVAHACLNCGALDSMVEAADGDPAVSAEPVMAVGREWWPGSIGHELAATWADRYTEREDA